MLNRPQCFSRTRFSNSEKMPIKVMAQANRNSNRAKHEASRQTVHPSMTPEDNRNWRGATGVHISPEGRAAAGRARLLWDHGCPEKCLSTNFSPAGLLENSQMAYVQGPAQNFSLTVWTLACVFRV